MIYVVATPIGNLGDITFRAIETLKSVDVIACEDTRTTKILCEKYGIETRLISYHKYSENARLDLFLGYLKEGKKIALVSDAGTPSISDPGGVLIDACYKNGYKVVSIPGASAVVSFLSSIPREDEEFKFIGFLPRTKGKIEGIVRNLDINTVFYESPKRLLDTLNIVSNICPDLKIAIGRELTKKFEEIKIDNPKKLIKYFSENTLKGEIVGMFYPQKNIDLTDVITKKVEKLKEAGLTNKDITASLCTLYGYNKNEVNKICMKM